LVFEETQADVSRARGCEFGGAAGDERYGFVLDGGCEGVEGVGGYVGAAIDHADEGEGFREDEVVRAGEEGG